MRFTPALAVLAALAGACTQGGGVPVAIQGPLRPKTVPHADQINVTTDPTPYTSGPHQTSIVITSKGNTAVARKDITATVPDPHTIIITVKTTDPFVPTAP